ncbi:MAG: rhodanese-like domain-containing protein [Zoogloeaceae bacterium]|jgi:rhodanese-related sulfurtransferase|nr:rhodanese-like domain-containing protein [Zoogloeaceae bacterium]
MGKLTDLLELARERAQGMPFAGALTPAEAWEVWHLAPGARLVDVRTRAELDWVGRIPETVEIEWTHYPSGAQNPHFLAHLKRQVERNTLVMFICRAGHRSRFAATLAAEAGYTASYNVLEGFEGEPDAHHHRNKTGGWRFANLPWFQN